MEDFEQVFTTVSQAFHAEALKKQGKIMADLQKLNLMAQKPLLKVFFDAGVKHQAKKAGVSK